MTERRRRRKSPAKRQTKKAPPSATRDRSHEYSRPRSRPRSRGRIRTGTQSTLRPSARTPLWVGTLLGVAFACGIVFGKQDAKQPAVDATDMEQTVGAILDEADRSAERYEEIKDKLRLTFHEELKKAEPLLPVAATRPAPARKKPNPHDAAQEGAGAKPPEHAKPPPQPVSTPARATKPVAESIAKPAAPRLADLKSAIAARAGAAQKVAQAPPERVVPAAPPEPKPAAQENATQARPHFVQVASFPEGEAAQRLVQKLDAAGIPARVSAFDLGGGRTAHRVITSAVPSKEAADALAARVKSATGLSGLVRRKK